MGETPMLHKDRLQPPTRNLVSKNKKSRNIIEGRREEETSVFVFFASSFRAFAPSRRMELVVATAALRTSSLGFLAPSHSSN